MFTMLGKLTRKPKKKGIVMLQALFAMVIMGMIGYYFATTTSASFQAMAAGKTAEQAEQYANLEAQYLQQLGFDAIDQESSGFQHSRQSMEELTGDKNWESKVEVANTKTLDSGNEVKIIRISIYKDSDGVLASPRYSIDMPMIGGLEDVTKEEMEKAIADVQTEVTNLTNNLNQYETEVNNALNSLNTNVSNNTNSINSLNTSVTNLQNETAQINQSITNINSSLTVLKDDIQKNKDAIVAANSNIKTISDSVSSITTRVTSTESKIDNCIKNIESMQSSLDTLKSNVDTLSGSVTTLQNQMTDVQGKTDQNTADLKAEISNREAAITTLENTIGTKLAEIRTDLSNLTNKMDAFIDGKTYVKNLSTDKDVAFRWDSTGNDLVAVVDGKDVPVSSQVDRVPVTNYNKVIYHQYASYTNKKLHIDGSVWWETNHNWSDVDYTATQAGSVFITTETMSWIKHTEKGYGFVNYDIYLNNQHIKELASNSESLLNYTGSFNVTKGDRIRIIMNMDSAPDANYSYRTLPTEEDTPTPGGFRIYADVIVYAIE